MNSITTARKARKWSQEELSFRAGVSQSVVSMVERDGKVSLHLQNCVRQALGLELLPEPVEAKPEKPPRYAGDKRGFASPAISKDRQREISAMGGRAAHAKGVAHRFTSADAKIEGAKGACRDPERMRELSELSRLRRSHV